MSPRRPNILFLMTDHQRADSLDMVQAGVEVAPTLNRLARQGAAFTRAYNTCPLCVPARTALATGKYPTSTGVVFNDWKGATASDHKPVHQYLADVGYDVGHVGVHHIRVEPGLQERVSFGKWIDNPQYAEYLKSKGLDPTPPDGPSAYGRHVQEFADGEYFDVRYSSTRTGPWPFAAEEFKDAWFAREAEEFLRRDRDRPFALFVYLWAPHPPLRVPAPYDSMFDPETLDLPANVGVPATGEPANRRRGIAAQLAEGVSLEHWRRVWSAHLGLVRLADDALGRVLVTLEEQGQANETITVFTVDHGDQLGQHQMFQKMEMYEPAIRIPLVFRAPGVGTGRIDAPVSHLDVMPTLLELAGLDVPDDLEGASLRGAICDGEALDGDRAVFSQYSGNPSHGALRRAVVTEQYKYVHDPRDVPELYDLSDDPLEMTNLAADPAHAAVRDRLHERGREWAAAHGDWVEF